MCEKYENKTSEWICRMLNEMPRAYAPLFGSGACPDIRGMVYFYGVPQGTLVLAEVYGLPAGDGPCGGKVFGFHIHEGTECSGNAGDPFADAKGHWNPQNCAHPAHAGDLPPLFGNRGFAWSAFYTERFAPEEILGRTVIVHELPDDFHSQPSGSAGRKLACGIIMEY